MSFTLLPAAFHDLTPVHELAYSLPRGAQLFGDKAYNSADDEASILTETGVRLIPIRKANMQPHDWFVDDLECTSIAIRLKPSTVNWKRWVWNAYMPARMSALS